VTHALGWLVHPRLATRGDRIVEPSEVVTPRRGDRDVDGTIWREHVVCV
jgi:hypothetical protein